MTKQHNFYGMGLIRLLLAISVIQAHTSSFLGYSIANGLVAVQVFYIFSGFYMFMILTEKYTSIKSFYKSRFLRIFPTYLIITIPLLRACLETSAFIVTRRHVDKKRLCAAAKTREDCQTIPQRSDGQRMGACTSSPAPCFRRRSEAQNRPA